MRINRCRWTRRRLAILAGDREGRDLRRDDLRHVERHLIACGSCRAELASLESAVGVLRASASVVPEAPASVWPALDREIRRSRHARPSLVLGLGFGPAMGIAAGLVVVGGIIGLAGWTLGSASRSQQARVDGPGYPRGPALPDGPPRGDVIAIQHPAGVDVDPSRTGSPRDPQRSLGQ